MERKLVEITIGEHGVEDNHLAPLWLHCNPPGAVFEVKRLWEATGAGEASLSPCRNIIQVEKDCHHAIPGPVVDPADSAAQVSCALRFQLETPLLRTYLFIMAGLFAYSLGLK